MTRRHLIAIALVVAAGWAGHQNVHAASWYVQIFSRFVFSPATPLNLKTVKFVNGNGAVAGTERQASTGTTRAFVWTLTDGYVDPGTLGASSATLVGLSDNRIAAGNSAIADGGPTRAFVWTKDDGMVDLGTLGGSSAEAADINNNGWVVGRSIYNDRLPNETRPFLWTPSGGMTNLCALGCPFAGFWSNGATRVSDSGIVAGYASSSTVFDGNGNRVYHAAVWDTTANTFTDLFTSLESLDRGLYSIADLVTNSGWVAGRISAFGVDGPDPSFQHTTGFVWSAATGVRHAYSRVTDLNDDGWATAVNGSHGFVVSPGQPDVDLGEILTNLPFFVLDNHIVVGHSLDAAGENVHAFYWDPETGRHEIDGPTDHSIAFNHRGERFVGINTSYDEETFETLTYRPFVWDGTVHPLMNSDTFLSNHSIQIGSSGFIAATLSDGFHAELAKVWAPPLSFSFTGFLPPNNNPYPLFNNVTAGSSVHLRFGLGGDRGPEALAWGYPQLVEVDCTTGALPIPDPTEPGPNFAQAPPVTFQKGADRYTFTWSPDPLLKNTCRAWMFRFIDGSGGDVLFKIR